MVHSTLLCALLLLMPLGALSSTPAIFGLNMPSCGSRFEEPVVPTGLPLWVDASADKLRGRASVKEIGSQDVFRKGEEIVIKSCTTKALQDVVDYVKPYPNHGKPNPRFDIYFDCGDQPKYLIPVKEELVFGTLAQNTFGIYRLIAPHKNVELNGGRMTRILKVHRYAHVTLYGLIFRDGRKYDMLTHKDDRPAGGWGGSALLASFRSTLVVSNCQFYNNWRRSKYVRFGSGGAIMAETGSKLYVWASYFKNNHGVNGGAIASSSAHVVYVAHSTFLRNVAHGGFDMSKEKTVNGVTKPVLQIRGGAMRVDSVLGHAKADEHVFVCNSKFAKNKVKLTDEEVVRFGYEAHEASYLFAGASAFALWNKHGTLELEKADHNLLNLQGCVFEGNFEQMPWPDNRAGRYVVEARGAGHIDVTNCKFTNNQAQFAVLAIDNSDFFPEKKYDLMMREISFENNGDIANLRFPPRDESRCDVQNVDGMIDGTKKCKKLIVGA